MRNRKDDTRKDLELAFARVLRGRGHKVAKERKLSISAVADEAGLSAATIHNRYPDIAEQIRTEIGKSTRAQRDQKQLELQDAHAANRKLRDTIKELEARIVRLASENARLLTENATLSAIADAKNVVLAPAVRKGT
jgi:AcrR family transcriptional regulator